MTDREDASGGESYAKDLGYDLVMPFLSVASVGGPHDDESYVCGYEMGRLDTYLERDPPAHYETFIHPANRAQADLIAMRYQYVATFLEDEAAEHPGVIAVAFDWKPISDRLDAEPGPQSEDA